MDNDLRLRLLRYHGRDTFLREMRDFVRYGGELTPAQARKAERHLVASAEIARQLA